jgi:uncharacterized damage-inducible protein DinB
VTRDFRVHRPAGVPPEVGVWSFALEDQRRRTLSFAEGLEPLALERTPPGAPNSIGTLLYHCAATEMNWLFEDILEADAFTPEVQALLPYPYRDDAGRLWNVVGETFAQHVDRLAATRRILLGHVHALSPEEFVRERRVADYVATPEWIVYHLLEHEAHHAGEIRALRYL